ncbi:hypothetical protein ACRALDRAFT_211782 [Sodiomyces alcalophilus JCM 7366]|uniref:uncharacterized protein n=1 Tax=Sodiomyces alcalophilus JCM 7366 TaxID=591952 RepID=UPI0039B57884
MFSFSDTIQGALLTRGDAKTDGEKRIKRVREPKTYPKGDSMSPGNCNDPEHRCYLTSSKFGYAPTMSIRAHLFSSIRENRHASSVRHCRLRRSFITIPYLPHFPFSYIPNHEPSGGPDHAMIHVATAAIHP